MTFTYEYPRPSVTVDCVVFGVGHDADPSGGEELQVLLVERAAEPFKGCLSLPGGFVNVSDDGDQGEDIDTAAYRELEEETGTKPDHLEQLCTVGTPGRDPRGRVITVAYMALVRSVDHKAVAGSDAKEAAWHSLRTASVRRGPPRSPGLRSQRDAASRVRPAEREDPLRPHRLQPASAEVHDRGASRSSTRRSSCASSIAATSASASWP